ncbi:MAG: tetratricopeptide repeat protein [Hydrogenophilaceae bacterium]|jgi:tetratricopeptide (TPR) repeat protein|nr:tetratricopeptide repeat protein [Hydrogenophilaceae bacterium]
MDLQGKSAALYGRFSAGVRERLAAAIARRGARVARDLTLRSDVLVVGALAATLIEPGHLSARLAAAKARRVPVYGERGFTELLIAQAEAPPPSLSVAPLLRESRLTLDDVAILAAFDIVRLEGEQVRFADAGVIKSAGELAAAGRSLADIVRILTKARDRAPKGRRKIVIDPRGEAALQWESGLSTLEGQGLLPLEDDAASLDDLFEAAAIAEARGDLAEAARLYEMTARADRKDAIASYNLGNIHLAAGAHGEAVLAFRTALAREPDFLEARYNLAQACEGLGKVAEAREALTEVLRREPRYADARFNLAQLELKRGAVAEAKAHFELYLFTDPPADWAAKARRAIQYCTAKLSA